MRTAKTLLMWCAMLATAGAGRAVAEDSAASPEAAAQDGMTQDIQDVYLLSPGRPILVRLHVQRGGESYQAIWAKRLVQMFHDFDLDKSGDLDDEEYDISRVENLLGNRRGPAGETLPQSASLVDVDVRPADARVSMAEFVEAFGRSSLTTAAASSPRRDSKDDALLVLLDRDGSPGISASEAAAARTLLAGLDTNDDEMLAYAELNPNVDPRNEGRPLSVSAGYARVIEAQRTVGLIMTPLPETPGANIARTLLRAYDRAGEPESAVEARSAPKPDGKLTTEEFELPTDEFAALDGDTSGGLDVDELTVWVQLRQPDLEALIRQGGDEVGQAEQVAIVRNSAGFDVSEGRAASGRKSVALANSRVRVEVTTLGEVNAEQAARGYKQRFMRVDQDNNEYLDAQEYNRGGFDSTTFPLADRDNDGKVFLRELLAYQEFLLGVSQSRVAVTASDQGSTLPEILDGGRDGRLSPRELANLADRVTGWDRDGNGQVTAEEIPRQYSLTIGPDSRGSFGFSGNFVVAQNGFTQYGQAQIVRGEGPEWFHRMDRNSNGDVSRREFLGPLAMFETADADHDGLLSTSEAVTLETP